MDGRGGRGGRGGGDQDSYYTGAFHSTPGLLFIWLVTAVLVTAFLVGILWVGSLYFMGAAGGKGSRGD